jgi:glucan biosynthesis protein C
MMSDQIASAQAGTTAHKPERLHYLDWVRVFAILMVFVYHSSRFFNLETWHIKNPTTYAWVEVWNRFAANWMMPLILVISGASLFFAVGKGEGGLKGAAEFLKDKVLRLLVPWLVGTLTHTSLQVYLERRVQGQFSGSYLQFLPHYFAGMYEDMHLWYLQVLFVFSIILYPLLRWLRGRGRSVLARFGDLVARPGAVYALALPTVLLLVLVDRSSPVMKEEAGWPLVIYLWLALSGFAIVSHERVQASIQRLRWLSLAMAVVLVGSFISLWGLGDGPPFGSARYALAFGLRGLSSWCWILAILGFGIRHLRSSTPFVRYANEAVLPFYILHQTVLLGMGYLVVQWAIPSLLRWAIILLASFAIIMALYELLVRRFNVMRILFGMKPKVVQPIAQRGEALPVR